MRELLKYCKLKGVDSQTFKFTNPQFFIDNVKTDAENGEHLKDLMRRADRAYLKETFGDDSEIEVASPASINDREQKVFNKHREPLKPDLFRNANQEVHFDRHKVKMSQIPIEFLYNDKMNFLKAIDLNKPNVTIAAHI